MDYDEEGSIEEKSFKEDLDDEDFLNDADLDEPLDKLEEEDLGDGFE